MDKQRLTGYLEQLDQALRRSADLYIYGSAAFILLDEPDRTSLDIDVAGPYSNVDMGNCEKPQHPLACRLILTTTTPGIISNGSDHCGFACSRPTKPRDCHFGKALN